MIHIVGLGNPGEKYLNTRHNFGFMVVDELAKKMLRVGQTKWQKDLKANALVLSVSTRVLLIKPQAYMNASGLTVKSLLSDSLSLGRLSSDLWVIHDDVDLPLGKLKLRVGGGTAGHHGVESIIKALASDQFVRFRLGIGKPIRGEKAGLRSKNSVEEYVLQEFNKAEQVKAKALAKKAVRAILVALNKGIEKAMNQFN